MYTKKYEARLGLNYVGLVCCETSSEAKVNGNVTSFAAKKDEIMTRRQRNKVNKNQPLKTINVCPRCHSNATIGWWDIFFFFFDTLFFIAVFLNIDKA